MQWQAEFATSENKHVPKSLTCSCCDQPHLAWTHGHSGNILIMDEAVCSCLHMVCRHHIDAASPLVTRGRVKEETTQSPNFEDNNVFVWHTRLTQRSFAKSNDQGLTYTHLNTSQVPECPSPFKLVHHPIKLCRSRKRWRIPHKFPHKPTERKAPPWGCGDRR